MSYSIDISEVGIKETFNNIKKAKFRLSEADERNWEDSFDCFYRWAIENNYQENLQLDRIDNNGDYEPSNCQFISIKENTRKRTTSKINMDIAKQIRCLYEFSSLTQQELGNMFDINRSNVSMIVNNIIWRE